MSMTRAEGDRFSHRGRGLLLIGAVWIMVGINVLTDGPSVGGVVWPLTLLDPPLRSALWIVTGAGGVLAALTGAGRARTKFAFAALVIPPSLRSLSFFYSWVQSWFTDQGTADGWVHGIAWALIVLMVLHEASAPVIVTVLRRERHVR